MSQPSSPSGRRYGTNRVNTSPRGAQVTQPPPGGQQPPWQPQQPPYPGQQQYWPPFQQQQPYPGQQPPWQGQQQPPPWQGQTYPGQHPPPGYGQPPRPPRRRGKKVLVGLVFGLLGLFVIIAIAASLGGGSKPHHSAAPPRTQAPAAQPTRTAAAAAPKKVKFVVKGSPADVTWGSSGSNHQGSVPMRKTIKLGHPLYYSITAQLSGSGRVSCSILIGGKVISHASASGSYNIASCEISRNVISGKWEDTNSG